MTVLTIRDLAELVAFKARLGDADEAVLLGIERALVEVVYLVRQKVADELEVAQHEPGEGWRVAAGELRASAAKHHLEESVKLRHQLHGYLVDTRRQFVPFDQEVFPPDDSKLQLAMAFRRTRGIYEDARDRWERQGIKAGHEADELLLKAIGGDKA